MKRLENEKYEDFKVRRTEENNRIKNMLKGKMIWYSKNNRNSDARLNQGTYIKEK